jgi:hypothetical protein
MAKLVDPTLSSSPLLALLAQQGFVVLGGGLATALERRGHDLSQGGLWSARCSFRGALFGCSCLDRVLPVAYGTYIQVTWTACQYLIEALVPVSQIRTDRLWSFVPPESW